MKRITVLLADDHMMMREGLRMLLELEKDIQIVGEAEDGRQAVAMVKKLRPAVVLMDIAMPLLNGLEATRQIRKEFPDTRVLILSAHSHAAFVKQLDDLGAAGFLLKQTSSAFVATAIREVQKGKTFFSPSIAKRLLAADPKSLNRDGQPRKKGSHLSSRETEVLQLIAEGQSNKQVAAELGLSFKTVDNHRQSLMGKLNIHDIAGLTRYAIAEGIIEGSGGTTIS
ncbi:MAG: response regulator transcription factor [Akkermansiaceae bacterium]|nr:response regulator transcription factor [Verrucomicrobiales bacterium]